MYTKEQIELASETLDELVVEVIAVACHQQNRTSCQMIGDDSQPNWDQAAEWQRDSAVAGVKQALINANPAMSHESWLEHKRATGWVYGKEKDPEKKTHHCMVPYSDLPEEQKKKDGLYIDMVQQLGLSSGLISLR